MLWLLEICEAAHALWKAANSGLCCQVCTKWLVCLGTLLFTVWGLYCVHDSCSQMVKSACLFCSCLVTSEMLTCIYFYSDVQWGYLLPLLLLMTTVTLLFSYKISYYNSRDQNHHLSNWFVIICRWSILINTNGVLHFSCEDPLQPALQLSDKSQHCEQKVCRHTVYMAAVDILFLNRSWDWKLHLVTSRAIISQMIHDGFL